MNHNAKITSIDFALVDGIPPIEGWFRLIANVTCVINNELVIDGITVRSHKEDGWSVLMNYEAREKVYGNVGIFKTQKEVLEGFNTLFSTFDAVSWYEKGIAYE